jgi:hypothetical protein
MGGSEDPDEAAGEPADDAAVAQLYAGAPARAAAVLDADTGRRRVALAAGDGLWLLDAGDGAWRRAEGANAACSGAPIAVSSLDFALEPGSGARLLVAGGWAPGGGPLALLSRGAMAGSSAHACDWVVRCVLGAGGSGGRASAAEGTCIVRVDPAAPQRLYALVLPGVPPAGCLDAAVAAPPAGAAESALSVGSPDAAAATVTPSALAAAAGGSGSLWMSPDLGVTWQLLGPVEGSLPQGSSLTGLALCGTRPGRIMLTGRVPTLQPGQVPVTCGNSCGGRDSGNGTPEPSMGPLVLYSADGGSSFVDASVDVAAAAEPALAAARARHTVHQAAHPRHAAHCRHRGGPGGAGAALPLFLHAAAVLGLGDGQLLVCGDVEAGEPWHAACQLPGPITALVSDDGLSAPSALPLAPRRRHHGCGSGGGGGRGIARATAEGMAGTGVRCGASSGTPVSRGFAEDVGII